MEYQSGAVVENDWEKILGDFSVHTDFVIEARILILNWPIIRKVENVKLLTAVLYNTIVDSKETGKKPEKTWKIPGSDQEVEETMGHDCWINVCNNGCLLEHYVEIWNRAFGKFEKRSRLLITRK